ncbi:VWA domain-containing protein [Aestuariicella hydrocarbonica]|uniref:VWA domain-containing protein n=1 Tax=Pseudomaricurvus hydrocarbonicus TaxID=1470433 RepID=A0A9E5JWB0_9GAMM|nr:VWA domain-containing protein [Aestuariicella hydrocarbonica]NHO66454.1 VWA domain-containing protein [Aestuariicella hydrocarbonica]
MPDAVVSSLIEQFHWQRPLWLLGIPMALLAGWYLLRSQSQSNQWKTLINPELLPYLLQGSLSKQQRWPVWMMTCGLILACLAIAGPSWEKMPQPIHKTENALIILLDMSPSMMAEDLKPSRLVRARLKLTDLLKQRKEGLTALVAYAGEAYTVTPLTDDSDTVISLLPALSPQVMPLSGSNTEMAMDQALKLFKDGGLLQGDILLVTDGVATEAQQYLRRTLPAGFRLSILGVGTEAGAPVPIRHGGFAKDNNGGIVLAKLNATELSKLAKASGGKYRTLSHNDRDINALMTQPELLSQKTRQLEREFDTWVDRGAWLSLLLIPFVALGFRRGWLLLIPLLLILPEPSYAFGWKDLWQTPDQQAQALLKEDKAAEAAQTFKRQDWKAAAQYKAQNFEAAAQGFAEDNSAQGHYNRGNALAKAGKYPEALDAYDEALQQQPDFDDAKANKELVEQLLQQQQNQQQSQNNDSESQDNDQNQQPQNAQDQDQGSDGQSSDQQDSDSQDPNQENAEQQGSDQPNSEQQSSEQQSSEQQQSEQNDADSSNSDPANSQDRLNPDSDTQQADKDQDQQAAGQDEAQQDAAEHASDADSVQAQAQEGELSDEEKQAMEQWLRKIPDDPSGLMRKKFEYQYRQRRLEYQQGSWLPPDNQANKRW